MIGHCDCKLFKYETDFLKLHLLKILSEDNDAEWK